MCRRGGKVQRVERQKRDDETKPDEIDKYDEEEGRHLCRPGIAHPPRRGKSLAAGSRIFGEGRDHPPGEKVSEARPAKPAILGISAPRCHPRRSTIRARRGLAVPVAACDALEQKLD